MTDYLDEDRDWAYERQLRHNKGGAARWSPARAKTGEDADGGLCRRRAATETGNEPGRRSFEKRSSGGNRKMSEHEVCAREIAQTYGGGAGERCADRAVDYAEHMEIVTFEDA